MKKIGGMWLAWLLVPGVLTGTAGSVAAAGPGSTVEPIFTRQAKIYQSPTLDTRVEFFKDKPMEEMDDFDGYGVTLDFTYPINEMSQIWILAPLYTNGDGDYRKAGHFADGQSVDDLLLDGMHPNDNGHALIAELLAPLMEDACK